MTLGLDSLAIILLYILVGSGVHTVYGIYKVYTTYLFAKLNWKRILIEFSAAMLFGLFGAFTVSSLVPFQIGAEFGGLFSAILGARVVNLVGKRFGLGKNLDVVVSDQQLGLCEFNSRQLNALEYVKRDGKITNKIYQRLNDVSRNTSRWEL